MNSGPPNMLGSCVGQLVYNHSVLKQGLAVHPSDDLVAVAKGRQRNETRTRSRGRLRWSAEDALSRNIYYDTRTRNPKPKDAGSRHLRGKEDENTENPVALLYITSDNPSSAAQIREYAEKLYNRSHNREKIPTIVAPKGCHVDMDNSFDCSLLTITQWLILSASDYIVTQTDKTGSPISAYSRYAAIYGLKGDSLRDGRSCSTVQPLYSISRRWNGNWFCD